jgi:hypothetical protein
VERGRWVDVSESQHPHEREGLARYGHTDVLARLADISARREHVVWLLLPSTATLRPSSTGAAPYPSPTAPSSSASTTPGWRLRPPAEHPGDPAGQVSGRGPPGA